MSYRIETANGQQYENFGFFGSDIASVKLGRLSPMPTEQFCNFSANTIIIALENAEPKLKAEIGDLVEKSTEVVKNLPQRTNPLSNFHNEMKASLKESVDKIDPNSPLKQPFDSMFEVMVMAAEDEIRPYLKNPFEIEGPNVTIDRMYKLTLSEFTHFTTYVLQGGIFGWGDSGVPKEAKENLQKIQNAIKILV